MLLHSPLSLPSSCHPCFNSTRPPITFPPKCRRGSVLSITQAEYNQIKSPDLLSDNSKLTTQGAKLPMIHEIIPVGPLQCNCSILGDETSHEAIVVDPGDDIPRILALLAKHHLTVKKILITHAHIDHIAGAHRLKQITGAPILYNKHDLAQVKMMADQAAWLGVPTPTVSAPDDTLDEGKIITIGANPEQSQKASPATSSTPPDTPKAASASTSPTTPSSSPETPSSPAP